MSLHIVFNLERLFSFCRRPHLDFHHGWNAIVRKLDYAKSAFHQLMLFADRPQDVVVAIWGLWLVILSRYIRVVITQNLRRYSAKCRNTYILVTSFPNSISFSDFHNAVFRSMLSKAFNISISPIGIPILAIHLKKIIELMLNRHVPHVIKNRRFWTSLLWISAWSGETAVRHASAATKRRLTTQP
jgi:hypothetical protein